MNQESTNRSEHELTHALDQVVQRVVPGYSEFQPIQRFEIKRAYLPIVTATLNWADEQPHQAKRGDEVEAWIKERRDGCIPDGPAWRVLDDFLDDYRLHSDTGTKLGEPTGPWEDPDA